MNIQQINGSGHNIWVFAVTSIAALLFTGLTWFSIEAINHIKASLHKMIQDSSNMVPEIRLGVSDLYAWVAS